MQCFSSNVAALTEWQELQTTLITPHGVPQLAVVRPPPRRYQKRAAKVLRSMIIKTLLPTVIPLLAPAITMTR